MPPRRRRRTFRVPEQLSLSLTTPAPPVVEREQFRIGHFVGILMSDRTWQLTVAPPDDVLYDPGRTPQQWWAELAPDEFTLHQWAPCGARIVGEREDIDVAPKPIDERRVATRWLRCFNEAFQTWRMANMW